MGYHVVIPARYASTRLPAKPLADIGGRPMVVRVVEAALRSAAADVVVATDDARVLDAVAAHGHRALTTRTDHPSGTDRIAEVADLMGWGDEHVVVNVQGDEPLIDPRLVDQVAKALEDDTGAAIATAAHRIGSVADFLNPNVVKVVTDAAGRALYFSRAPIPWPRDEFAARTDAMPAGFAALRHVGIYAYRVGFLRRYGRMAPAPCETWECLEQLRALWHGQAIRVIECADPPAAGVDTAEDLARVRAHFAELPADRP